MTPSPTPSFEIDSDQIGWIVFDDPDRSMNVLTEAVMLRLGEVVDQARGAAREGRLRAVVVTSGKANSFMAGADIEVIGGVEDPSEAEHAIKTGQSIYDDLEALPVPTVAAIHGVCMGGGVEMALSCDRRVLSDHPKTKLGLPEVQLGILPAWGGTTRLPRLVGLQAALDMLLTGKRLDSKRCRRIGLASSVVPADLFRDAVRTFVKALIDDPSHGAPKKRRLRTRVLDDTPPGRAIVLRTARKRVLAQTGGHYPAPLAILEILRDHLSGPAERSLAAEAAAAAKLLVSPVCKNLVHVFHMREAARKADGIGGSGDSAADEVSAMGVLGAGVMGGGVAQLAASRGVSVYMKDIDHGAVTGGLQHARSLLDRRVKRRRMTKREAAHQLERISGGLDYHGLSGADVIVEAIVEKMAIKKSVLRETEDHISPTCILATNTSSLSVSEMASALQSPARFCGMHFFNPVHRMPLVEVIRGPESSDRTIATIYRLAVRLGKVPVVVGDGPGFLVNRILGPYLNEAGFLLEEVGSVETIDRVATVFGMPMGPLRLVDEVGIDVSGHAGASLHEGLGERLAPAPLLTALQATGRLGKKGGLGFYRYENGKEKGVDSEVYGALGLSSPPAENPLGDEVVRRRLVLAMVNEAARILEDGIARSAADIDLAMIMGTGFPPFRGGLLRFADTLHPRGVLAQVQELSASHGSRFEPAPLLVRLAEEDRTFYEAFPSPTAT
ncbi:MAG: 3-hydroxyacyl-CoA dehydrogenase NAD-binding domain-containing protein [Gemmatimonadota bacterium]